MKKIILAGLLLISPVMYADPWKFEVAPYLWAMNLNGDVGVATLNAHVSQDFTDLLKYFQGGAMLYLDANKDRFGLFANALYSVLEQNTNVGPYTIHSKMKFGLYSFGISYAVYEEKCHNYTKMSVQPYIGARITTNDASLNIVHTTLAASNNHSWTDPIIGARLLYNFDKNWQLILAGDVGGTNFNTDKSINFNGFIDYTSQKHLRCVTWYLGYRWLKQKYSTGSGKDYFLWNMRLFGPVLGFGINF